MKKIVFKGVINDEEFDNVKDYNNRMSELIGKGGSINAHSETRYADEVVENTANKEVKRSKPKTSSVNPDLFLPFFNDGGDYYLDRFVTGDDDVDKKTSQIVKEKLGRIFDNFVDYIHDPERDVDELLKLMFNIKGIKKQIEEDGNSTVDACDNIESENKRLKTEINENYRQLNILNSSKDFIEIMYEYYQKSFDMLKGLLLGF